MKLTIRIFLAIAILMTSFVPFKILAQEESIYSAAAYKSSLMLAPENDGETIIVQSKISDEETLSLLQEILPDRGIKKSPRSKYFVVETTKANIQTDLASLLIYGDIWSAEPNYIFESSDWTVNSTRAVPDDYLVNDNWNVDKIKLPEAYKNMGCDVSVNCGGSSDVVVAVLDTGAAFEDFSATYDYKNLEGTNISLTNKDYDKSGQFPTASLWQNPNEDYDGIDDDANYYCDDKHGADVVQFWDNSDDWLNETELANLCSTTTDMQKSGHPNDDDGHGTFVSNMIVGAVDDGASSFGIAFNVKIMPVKVLDYTGRGKTLWIADGIYYAVDEGADIINMSIADGVHSSLISDALTYAASKNVVVVIASGNFQQGVSTTPVNQLTYPSAYSKTHSNVISVGATNPSDVNTPYSHYENGLTLVAPVGNSNGVAGGSIKANTFTDSETWGTNDLATRDFTSFQDKQWVGTSFAAPQVSAVAALVKGKNNHEMVLAAEIKKLLQTTARDVNLAGYDWETGYGVVDAQKAWDKASSIKWSDWAQSNPVDGDIYMTVSNSKLYQSVVKSGYVWTRINTNHTWGSWQQDNFYNSYGKVWQISFGSKLYQTIQTGGFVWTRTHDGTSWSSWVKSGGTTGDVYMVVANGKLYQTVLVNGYLWTRINNGTVWSEWVMSGHTDYNKVFMKEFNNVLYQTVQTGGFVWTRTHNGSSWSAWVKSGGTYGDVYMEVNSGKLYQTVIVNGYLWTRINNGSSWSAWVMSGYTNYNKVWMISFGGLMYQTVQTDGYVWTRTHDGSNWSAWVKSGATQGDVFMEKSNGILYQTVVVNGFLWTRMKGTGDWAIWVMSGYANYPKVFMVDYSSKLYQAVNSAGNVWLRTQDGTL